MGQSFCEIIKYEPTSGEKLSRDRGLCLTFFLLSQAILFISYDPGLQSHYVDSFNYFHHIETMLINVIN